MESIEQVYSVSDFFEILNQNLEYSYPDVIITGEVSSFKINQNKWVFFDIKDDQCSIGCFMSIYQLNTPIEDGMLVKIRCTPKLTKWGKFSLTVKSIELAGEGSIKKAFELLYKKLESEGLFLESKKRILPKYPKRIGLITSKQAAAYNDFVTIVNNRWSGLVIDHIQVQVQGDQAIDQIISAITQFNKEHVRYDVIVLIRGGGSMDDLQIFNTEPLTRAIYGSKIPTLVAIGHEDDTSLAELSADLRATTPTNAAQLVVPDKAEEQAKLENTIYNMRHIINLHVQEHYKSIERFKIAFSNISTNAASSLNSLSDKLFYGIENILSVNNNAATRLKQSLRLLDPNLALKRGYAITRKSGVIIRSVNLIKPSDIVSMEFYNGSANAKIIDTIKNKK